MKRSFRNSYLLRKLSTVLLLSVLAALAQRVPQPIPSLKRVEIPKPANLSTYVRDPNTLVTLGKALFWDLQVGSDGKIACATCHFHAGADHRLNNQLSNARGAFPLNYRLAAADFPFHQLADPANQSSRVIRDSTNRAGSSGMFARKFDGLIPGLPADNGADVEDKMFRIGDLNLRQAGDRNAPSVLNSVFYFRNFWDGRASDTFTGATPFGLSDTRAIILSSATGSLKTEALRLDKSSLASQSVGPVLNLAEMSYDSRSWPRVGKKMLALRPLANQRIASDDSVLGRHANPRAPGFPRGITYLDLVKAAFQPAYWDSAQIADESGNVLSPAASIPEENRFTQAEYNFSLFFGLAIQAYEATLVSDETPMDRFADGQVTALNNSELSGMRLFTGRTGCTVCHAGAEFSLATYSGVNGNDPVKSGRDTGYFYVGVRPIAEDLGLGALDGFGKPLATTLPGDDSPASARGRFKTPGLRNIEFTGPYFHNGSQATLGQVMEFYNRGGDFPVNASNGPDIRPLTLSLQDQADLVSFMKALTDDRVRYERAPFDHPELCVPDGHLQAGGASALRPNGNPAFSMSAADRWVGIPAVGRNGNTVPLQTFEELLAGVGVDGSRAHHMSDACAIEPVTATEFVSANAASFQRGILAQDSIVTAFGTNLSFATAAAESNPAPTNLAGLTVSVEDSAGVARNAPLFFVSPAQFNFLLPEGTAPGPSTITVVGGATPFRASVLINAVSPGLFGAGGLAAANVITFRNGVQSATNTLRVGAGGNLELVPIDLVPDDQGPDEYKVFLILYGTGIRHHAAGVSAKIGSAMIEAAYAGPQGTFAGQDQINIELPRSLRGAGIVDVALTVDGQTTNTVKIHIQ
jgi:uncharacterized protein (TIGR03437 family)